MPRFEAECRVEAVHGPQLINGPDARAAATAAESFGVLSHEELLACGLSAKQIKTRAARGHLHRRHRGVYAVGHANLTLQGRFLAAVKACGAGALLSHRAAGAAWGLLGYEERDIDVTIPTAAPRRVPGLVIHRCTLAPEDRRLRDGIPLTSPERTIIDLAGQLREPALRRAVREAQARQLVSVASLLRAMERTGRRRGSATLRLLIASGPAPTRSELEDVVLDLLLSHGIEHPDVNKPLVIDGRRVIPDFRWARQRLVLEADGAAWHEDKLAREGDAERQALLEAAGERVIRVTWHQAVRRGAETLKRLKAAGAPRVSC